MTDHRHEWTPGGRPGCPIFDYCRSCGARKPGNDENPVPRARPVILDSRDAPWQVTRPPHPRSRPYGGHPEFGPRVVANSHRPSLAGWEALAKDALLAWEAECHLLDRMRTYARHAPFCNYSPTYPDAPAATCDCGFDALLREFGE